MKKILYIALTAAMFVGCNKENSDFAPNGGNGGEVSFRATLTDDASQAWGDAATRASDGDWTLNDRVGVFVYNSTTTLNANAQYRIDNITTGAMSAVGATDKIYSPIGSTVDYYAYYPYSSEPTKVVISGTDVTYKVDVTDQRDLPSIDLMRATQAAQGGNSVNLGFSHCLTKLIFNLEAGYDVSSLTEITATLTGATARADFDLKTGVFSNPTSGDIALKVTAGETSNVATITAIVAPTADLKNCKVTFAVSGKKFQWSPATTAWKGGASYTYDITVGKPKAKIGDYYYSDNTWSTALNSSKTPIGLVFEVNADGKSGKIVSLDESSYLQWSNGNATTGATFDSDGAANMATIKNITGWDTKYPAFKWCDDKSSAGRVWYLPASKELKSLYVAWNGDRTGFNDKFTTANGKAISATDYWSSTESIENGACIVSFVNGGTHTFVKGDYLWVRGVSAF